MARDKESLRKIYREHIAKQVEDLAVISDDMLPKVDLGKVLDEIDPPVGEHECPVCRVGLKRSNCGKGYYCAHWMPMDVPCAECKKEKSNRIYWRCGKCGFIKAEIPAAVDWQVSLMPRVDGEYLEKFVEEEVEDGQAKEC
jgi:hypothetical protein